MHPMIVCVCKAVSDRHIRAAVKDGASSLKELSRQTGLGTCCGKCLPEARSTLAASLATQRDHSPREACVYFASPAPATV
jgi:bacterioferritin-associated ferredoxin